MRPSNHLPIALACLLCLGVCLCLGACKREQRTMRTDPPVAAALDAVRVMPNGIGGAPPPVEAELGHPYRTNAWEIAQGKRLFGWMGCKDCHGEGVGVAGRGPSLIDGWWRYGPDAVSIFISIRDGRPEGMPTFRAKLTTNQVWELTGYVQTLGAMTASAAATGRSDEKQIMPAENRAPAAEHAE